MARNTLVGQALLCCHQRAPSGLLPSVRRVSTHKEDGILTLCGLKTYR